MKDGGSRLRISSEQVLQDELGYRIYAVLAFGVHGVAVDDVVAAMIGATARQSGQSVEAVSVSCGCPDGTLA